MSDPAIWMVMTSATSSPVLAAGPTPFDWLESPTTENSGPEVALASRLAPPVNEKDFQTLGIFGRVGSISFASDSLQSYLESRLKALTVERGSTLFRLTWKVQHTPLGRRFSLLRALALRTAGIEPSSWPTPRVRMTGSVSQNRINDKNRNLEVAVSRKIWPTPTANRRSGLQSHGKNAILGVVNPEWLSWLMGYPTHWLNPLYEPLATPSSRKSPRRSSKPRSAESIFD
jgi:hypothetical protein